MMISKRLLWYGLQSCLYCGSLERHADGLCRVCSSDLWSWQEEVELFSQRIEDLEVLSLFHWIPGQQEVLSRLVRALKGTEGKDLWSFYAEEFWRRRLLAYMETKVQPMILIPSPSIGNKRDHASFFTQGLSAVIGASVHPCLQRASASKGKQKQKNRSERQKAAFEWSEGFTIQDFRQKSVGKQVIFVDDIVTTGSTAQAAWRRLGKPRDFAVWALAQRGLSCGASKSLI